MLSLEHRLLLWSRMWVLRNFRQVLLIDFLVNVGEPQCINWIITFHLISMSAWMFSVVEVVLLKSALERLFLTAIRIMSTACISIHIGCLPRIRMRITLCSFNWPRMINIASLLAVYHTLTALTLPIDRIVRRIKDLISHPSLIIVIHTLVQSLVILCDVVIRRSLILAYVLVRSTHGCARLVFWDKILLEQELLIIDIITLFSNTIWSRLSKIVIERLSLLKVYLIIYLPRVSIHVIEAIESFVLIQIVIAT